MTLQLGGHLITQLLDKVVLNTEWHRMSNYWYIVPVRSISSAAGALLTKQLLVNLANRRQGHGIQQMDDLWNLID